MRTADRFVSWMLPKRCGYTALASTYLWEHFSRPGVLASKETACLHRVEIPLRFPRVPRPGGRPGGSGRLRTDSGPLEKPANPITPENPIPRRSFSVAAVYPAEARGLDAQRDRGAGRHAR